MAQRFSAQIDAIILKTEKRMTALVRTATQEVIDQAQTPVSKGGRMRVDTGFLRASGQMSLTGMPSGPVRPDTSAASSYDYSDATVITQLGNVRLGDTIHFGWTAEYAQYRETYDGFLGAAVQNWQQIVNDAAEKIKRRIR